MINKRPVYCILESQSDGTNSVRTNTVAVEGFYSQARLHEYVASLKTPPQEYKTLDITSLLDAGVINPNRVRIIE